MPIIKATIGTLNPEETVIDTKEYGDVYSVGASAENYQEALDLLTETLDETFASDGHRNDDAVNTCIALHVMGYDAESWLEEFCKEQDKPDGKWKPGDLQLFMDHVYRVVPYLNEWGRPGSEGNALLFAIR